MDNVTHSLFGLMMSRAGLNRLTPKASLILMLAANAPDIDAVYWLAGTVPHYCEHRGHTHAWVFLPLLAILPVVIAWLFSRRETDAAKRIRIPGALMISGAGIASHLLLDWTNTYAIRWLLPFSAKWHTADLFFVIDPYVLMLFLLAVAAPALSKLVSGEIGAKRTSGQGWAVTALFVFALYAGGRWQAHERALAILNSRIYDRETPRSVIAVPEFASPLRWTGVLEFERSYRVVPVDLMQEFDPMAGRQFYKPEPSPHIQAASGTEAFRCFIEFNAAPLWRVTALPEPEGAVKVELYDLRFGTPVEPGFVATAELVGGRVVDSRFAYGTGRLFGR